MAKKLKPATREAVYAALLAHCPPAKLPGPWTELPMQADCFQCPADGAAALGDLQRQFMRQDLVRYGIAARTKTRGLRLVSALRRPTDYLVALRKRADAEPFDLVTQQGCLSGSQWPATAAFADHATVQALEFQEGFTRRLLLVFTMRELVLCRCLQIPAALAVGIDHGDLDLLDALTPICGWRARERDEYLGRISQEQLDAEAQALATWAERQAASTNPSDDANELDADELFDHASGESLAAAGTETERRETERTDPAYTDTTEHHLYPGPFQQGRSPSGAATPTSADDDGLRFRANKPLADKPLADGVTRKCELVILGWQMATLSLQEPAELAPLVEYLREVDRYLGIQVAASVNIWSPSKASDRLIEKRLEHQVLPGVVDAIQTSFDEEAYFLDGYGEKSRHSPTNFAEAAAQLRKALRGEVQRMSGPLEERIAKAMACFEQSLDKDIVTPLLDEAAKTSDHLRRSQLLMAAELSRMLHRETVVVDHRMEQAAANAAQRQDFLPEPTLMKSYLALVDRLLAVSKELAR